MNNGFFLYTYDVMKNRNNRLNIEYNSLEELDYHTLFYTEEQFLKKIANLYQDNSILISEPYIFEIKDEKLKKYGCLFLINDHPHLRKILSLFQSLAYEKMNKNSYSTLNDFEKLCYILLNNITSDRNRMLKVVGPTSFVDQKLKEYILSISSKNNFENLYPIMRKKLENYKILRGLVVEYVGQVKRYYVPELPFDSSYSIEEINVLRSAYQAYFSSDVVAELYKNGGIENVVTNLDTNDIYNLPLEDLLKLGIIDEKYYLARTLK